MRSLGEEMETSGTEWLCASNQNQETEEAASPHLARPTTGGEEVGIFRRRPAPGNLNPRLLLLLGPAGAGANSSRN